MRRSQGASDVTASVWESDLISRAKACGAEEWIAISCTLASVDIETLLMYVELVADADAAGRVKVDIDRLSMRVLGVIDRPAMGARVDGLRKIQLVEEGSMHLTGRRSWLVQSLCVYYPPDRPPPREPSLVRALVDERARENTHSIDLMIANPVAEVCFTRFGAGFGATALPASYPREGELGDRRAWAQRMLDGARDRAAICAQRDGVQDQRRHASVPKIASPARDRDAGR